MADSGSSIGGGSLIQQRLQFGDVEFRHLQLIVEHLGGTWQALQTRPLVWLPELRSTLLNLRGVHFAPADR